MTKYEYKCVRIKKNGLCKLIMNVCKKNVVLPREWAGIVVGIWSHHGMPRFECFSCSETAFVDYGSVVKVTVESLYFLNIFSQRSSLKIF